MSGELVRRQAVINLAKGWKGALMARDKPVTKRRIGIEEALRWAYRDELPKTPRAAPSHMPLVSQWRQVEEFFEELSLAGLDENRFGLVADPFAQSEPHPDAIRIHEAVRRLEEFDIDMPDGWPFVGDGEGALRCGAGVRDLVFGRDRQGARRLRFSVPLLLAHHAIMGDCPDWRVEDYAEGVETWPNGRPKYYRTMRQWFDGPNGPVEDVFEVVVQTGHRAGGVPVEECYTKAVLDPDPTFDLVSRAKYEVWRAALDVLAIDLEGELDTLDVEASFRAREPWVTGETRSGRILPDLSGRWARWLRFARGNVRGPKKKSASGG
jgi:hypothetical protein